MSEPELSPEQEQIVKSAQQLARSLVVAINEAPGKEHGRILKAYLLSGLERRFHYENMYWDWMRDVACAAVDNMQDARINILEAQVRALREKKGEDFSIGGFLIDLALMIALEAIIAEYLPVMAASAASAAMLGFASRSVAKRQRLRDRLLGARIDAYKATRMLEEPQKDLFLLRDYYRARDTKVRAEAMDLIYRSFGMMDRGFVDDLVMKQSKFLDKLDEVHPKLVTKEVTEKLNEQLVNFLEVANERVRENVATAISREALAVATPAAQTEVDPSSIPETSHTGSSFKSGHFLLPILDYVYGCKERNLREYCELKAALLVEDEDDLATQQYSGDLYGDLMSELPTLEGALMPNLAACAPDMLKGIELIMWLYYFADSLHSKEHDITTRTSDFDQYGNSEFFVVEAVQDRAGLTDTPSKTTASGRFYPGMSRMSPELADYLFRQYAKHYYDRHPNSKPPWIQEYRGEEYVKALKLLEMSFFNSRNQIRAQLIAEMKVFVIEYFVIVAAELKMKVTSGLFGDPQPLVDMFPGLEPIDDIVARRLKEWEADRAMLLEIEKKKQVDEGKREFEAAIEQLEGWVSDYRGGEMDYQDALLAQRNSESYGQEDLAITRQIEEIEWQLRFARQMIGRVARILKASFQEQIDLRENVAEREVLDEAESILNTPAEGFRWESMDSER